MKVSISFLSSKLSVKDTIKKINESCADYIHVDLMDGKFVKNKNYTGREITNLLKNTTKKLDVHLMVNNPLNYLDTFALLNTEYLTFHFEVTDDPMKMIEKIRNTGLKVGMSIKPKTKIKDIIPYLPYLDLVLLMSVNPGRGGQSFLINTKSKVEELSTLKKDNNFLISVDGGINEETAKLCENGDILVCGSFICQEDNYDEQIKKLLNF